jgi:aldose 1-epimerase
MSIESKPFGQTPTGKTATLWTLTNSLGNQVQLTDWGATVVSIRVPDRDGKLANVNWGFDSLAGYLGRHPHFGGTIGRFANRIAAGRFSLNGQEYTLAINNGPNHLHGGMVGFDHLLWKGEVMDAKEALGVRFTLKSADGDEGYPGSLEVVSSYTWNDQNELVLRYSATTDAPTYVNLTNHAYFNLAGIGSGKVLEHEVTLAADYVLDVDEGLIPTGRLNEVAGSVLDFRAPRKLGQSIDQLPATKGYDHCFVVRERPGTRRLAAKVYDPASGRTMEVETTQPGIQLYTGNHLQGIESSAGAAKHDGFCLETQHYPDSPNKPEFPTTLLKPGETLREETCYRFGVRK